MKKIKISEAFLRNCEGFMFEQVLLDKIDTYLKTDHEHGMTLKGLTNVSPRDLTATLGDGNPIFSKTEVSKIINLLAKFDLSLNSISTAGKHTSSLFSFLATITEISFFILTFSSIRQGTSGRFWSSLGLKIIFTPFPS